MSPDIAITDNTALHRYEAVVDGQTAILVYERSPGKIVLVHTEVPGPLRGHGLAAILAKHALDAARAEGLRVVPRCPYVQSWLKKHPEYGDLVTG